MYRLIDFPLSNCQHAQLPDVWVSAQFHPVSLAEHLSNGRPWDLDRSDGGLMMLQPHRGTEREGWHSGTADALWRAGPQIRDHRPDALVVLSSDAVYKLDYRQVVDAHLDGGSEVTMVTTEVDPGEAGRYGVVHRAAAQLAGDGARLPPDVSGRAPAPPESQDGDPACSARAAWLTGGQSRQLAARGSSPGAGRPSS